MNTRAILACVAAAGLALLGACASQRLHRDGLEDMKAGRYEEGIAKLEQAAEADPGNLTIRMDLRTRRDLAVQRLVAQADAARASGRLDEAQAAYERAMRLDPADSRVMHGLDRVQADRRHAAVLAQAEQDLKKGRLEQAEARTRTVLAEDPGSSAAAALRAKIDSAKGPSSVVPALKARSNKPVTLQFRDANVKMVFEVLSRQTGINFIFDKDVRADAKTTIFVQEVAVERAIDLLLGQNQLARQVLAENMALIYPNTAQKQKEYQDQVVRSFYLSGAEPKQAMEMLKTVLNAKTLFVDDRSRLLVMRDTPETVQMAERLLASMDVSEAEVMMEVEVLEVTRSRLQQLGIRYPTQFTMEPTPLAGDPLVLADLSDQDATTITITPLPVTVDLLKTVGVSNLLASPRIRARNREKAKILIGQRVPVITNSVTPIQTGSSVVTGSVQYVDVGLTLEVEPTVQQDRDVAIKIDLEVSNIIKEIFNETSGTLAYQIGTRDASTLLQLRDGETQILAGLINDTERRTSNHIPGLGDMPLLGRLFGTRKDDREATEIVLSITPRIIRAQPRPPSEDMEFWYGTEASVRGAPLGGGATVSTVAASDRGPAPRSPVVATDAAPVPEAGPEGDHETSGTPGRIQLTLDGPGQAVVGQEFSVTLSMAGEGSFAGLRSRVRFDPAALELVAAETGDAVPAALAASAVPAIAQRDGRVQLDVDAPAETPLNSTGTLLVLRFRAISPRPKTMIAVQQFAATTSEKVAVPVMAPRPLGIVVTAEGAAP